MRLLLHNYGDIRIFKDRSLFGVPRYIVESIDPDFGFRSTQMFSGIWYKEKDVVALVEKRLNDQEEGKTRD